MRQALYQWVHRLWYGGGKGHVVLLPLSALYWLVVKLRRTLYRFNVLRTETAGAPVVVVGNITAGGTGKTPTTVWLARSLAERGFSPGIVSRGYGGSKSASPMRVDADSDPAVVGDEPVLLARRSGCPVTVDRDRVRAARMLVEDGADLIIADDGLQHLRLARAYEICVVDGRRWFGNRTLLPAGPLREPVSRIQNVDQLLVNGRPSCELTTANEQNAIVFELVAREVSRLNGSLTRPIDRFAGKTVHAVAAIGNPMRYFDMLRGHGIQVIEHAYPDHAHIDARSLAFSDDFDILVTEKDAVKLGQGVSDRFWYVPVDLEIDPLDAGPWLEQIESRMKDEQQRS
ncbi:MAG: tetraacyldisaccharide 4'-kinase [Woeseiaceae bacterium]|nr:tetraacyldisaccharide 4'-kinase [Woeseiaceae bacterium]